MIKVWGLGPEWTPRFGGYRRGDSGLKICHLRRTLDSACDTGGVAALNLQLLLSRFYPHLKRKVSHPC